MFMVKTVDDLWNHIAYVLAYAPNDFPQEDFLTEDQQMNLDRAFDRLRDGVEIAYPDSDYEFKRASLNGLLDRSYAAYRSSDEIAAGHLLNEFQDSIFKTGE